MSDLTAAQINDRVANTQIEFRVVFSAHEVADFARIASRHGITTEDVIRQAVLWMNNSTRLEKFEDWIDLRFCDV